MLINTKEVASLLFLEIAFAKNAVAEKVLYEAKDLSNKNSEKSLRPRLRAYLTAKRNDFISLQKRIENYLQ